MATRSPDRITRNMENDRPANAGRVAESRPGIKAHRRFTLREVTLGDLPVGGATVDVWQDGGTQRWSARLLIPVAHPLREGVLAGTAAGGGRVSGVVHLGETTAGPRRGREVLVEFHGDSPLHVEEPRQVEAGRPVEEQAGTGLKPA